MDTIPNAVNERLPGAGVKLDAVGVWGAHKVPTIVHRQMTPKKGWGCPQERVDGGYLTSPNTLRVHEEWVERCLAAAGELADAGVPADCDGGCTGTCLIDRSDAGVGIGEEKVDALCYDDCAKRCMVARCRYGGVEPSRLCSDRDEDAGDQESTLNAISGCISACGQYTSELNAEGVGADAVHKSREERAARLVPMADEVVGPAAPQGTLCQRPALCGPTDLRDICVKPLVDCLVGALTKTLP